MYIYIMYMQPFAIFSSPFRRTKIYIMLCDMYTLKLGI